MNGLRAIGEGNCKLWHGEEASSAEMRPARAHAAPGAKFTGIPCTAGSTARLRSESTVDGVGGADQSEMGEGLGEVAQVLAGGAKLFGIEAHVVRVSEHLFEDEARSLHVAGAGQAFGKPKGAHAEGAVSSAFV